MTFFFVECHLCVSALSKKGQFSRKKGGLLDAFQTQEKKSGFMALRRPLQDEKKKKTKTKKNQKRRASHTRNQRLSFLYVVRPT